MIKSLPDALTANELLEKSFKKANKVEIIDRNAFFKKKKTIIAKTESFSTNIVSDLEKYVKTFPSIEDLPSFYKEFLEIKIGVNKLKKALGAINWARKTIQEIYSKQSRSLVKSNNVDFLLKKQREVYGRISSIVKQVNKELITLSDAQNVLKDLPNIQEIPTVVIAGYPNVGKSSILRCLSAAKPEIAQYPFTTKELHIGHIELKEKYSTKQIQIIDTPGLLDRPIYQRNDIEKQAIAALAHLADVIVFVIDPTETCGYLLTDQLKLLSQIKNLFNDCSFIIVENKVDIKKNDSGYLKISCETKEGIDNLYKEIIASINKKNNN
jgi:nucleolar GTP-binding protein